MKYCAADERVTAEIAHTKMDTEENDDRSKYERNLARASSSASAATSTAATVATVVEVAADPRTKKHEQSN
uniref:Uncharacterized protein n=1 Tax=Syphacia muris TaxID=451379 RepID=A0A0N5ACG4_9BILA